MSTTSMDGWNSNGPDDGRPDLPLLSASHTSRSNRKCGFCEELSAVGMHMSCCRSVAIGFFLTLARHTTILVVRLAQSWLI